MTELNACAYSCIPLYNVHFTCCEVQYSCYQCQQPTELLAEFNTIEQCIYCTYVYIYVYTYMLVINFLSVT